MEPLSVIGMVLMGLLTHFLKDLIRLKMETGRTMSPLEYFVEYPYQTMLCIVGACSGFIISWEAGELTLLSAYMIGYMSSSISDVIGKRK